jgi:hypothetical protein
VLKDWLRTGCGDCPPWIDTNSTSGRGCGVVEESHHVVTFASSCVALEVFGCVAYRSARAVAAQAFGTDDSCAGHALRVGRGSKCMRVCRLCRAFHIRELATVETVDLTSYPSDRRRS